MPPSCNKYYWLMDVESISGNLYAKNYHKDENQPATSQTQFGSAKPNDQSFNGWDWEWAQTNLDLRTGWFWQNHSGAQLD